MAGPRMVVGEDTCSLEDKLCRWRRLPTWYHNDQLNMCRFYGKVADSFLIEGLRLYELKLDHAPAIANEIRRVASKSGCLLSTAYSKLLSEHKTNEERIVEPEMGERTCEARKGEWVDHPNAVKDPLPSLAADWSGGQWASAVLDRPYYKTALQRASKLDKWCVGRWGTVHMNWDEISTFQDDGLTERDRLVYWLLRVWKTHTVLVGDDTPAIYDELLRRYVRDFNKKLAWTATGDQQAAILKWRNLDVAFHMDQIGMCGFYAKVSVAFFMKGLEAGGFLTSGEAAHVATLISEGEGNHEGGAMTGAHLSGFYTALLEDRVKVGGDQTKFFKKLRPGSQRSGRHDKQSKRVRILKHANLDESEGVPSLKPGVFVRQVANDSGGKAGVAPSTIRDAGDGGYSLKVIKEGEKICPYNGRTLDKNEWLYLQTGKCRLRCTHKAISFRSPPPC